ncbi:MAG: hypothetical protein Sylvanvirus16_10 [Sylvanvirus sp.]|uniref:Uncharacterized protein n=1 Tax=Sylvanvirus sp. TaxID=2487774 RepID=A0A3G5ALU5_9VIRU|nr:MAG: hypothetical protein Sylvanvirus16_10 [Sylvanvirus sp.]
MRLWNEYIHLDCTNQHANGIPFPAESLTSNTIQDPSKWDYFKIITE